MNQYARLAGSTSLEIVSAARPFSNFAFVDQRFGGLPTLRRVFSQARVHDYRTVVVEAIEGSADVVEENDDIVRRIGGLSSSKVWRLSFFSKGFKTRRGLRSADDGDFLGYAIVKGDDVPSQGSGIRVYESVMRPSRHANNFVRGAQKWPCAVGGERFGTEGYLYAQQNGLTNTCAHVALRTAAARFHPGGDMLYREMNKAAGIDGTSGRVGGLSVTQMREVLESAGATCFGVDYTQNDGGQPNPPFQKCLYGSVESGYPAILIFATTSGPAHAIPIFGHTFNEDTWVPNAEFFYFRVGEQTAYIPSESWVSMYIGHDDNCGSNFCVPRGYLHEQFRCEALEAKPPCPFDKADLVAAVIGTVPNEVKTDPIEAEVIGADYLFRILQQGLPYVGHWGERLALYAEAKMLVLRPVLLDRERYLDHLRDVRDWRNGRIDEGDIAALSRTIPSGRLWLVELSVPELFSGNRRKVADVLLDAERPPGKARDCRSFVIARLPGCFALISGDGASAGTKFRFLQNPLGEHVELYGCERA